MPKAPRGEHPAPFNAWFVKQRMSSGEPIPVQARARALAAARRAQAEFRIADAPGTWLLQGPLNVGGRVSALAADPHDPDHLWLGAAAGGVFVSSNGGVNWTTVFDGTGLLPIGAIAADPVASNVAYVGTGEANGAGYSYDGDGVYKTTDGGASWTHLGLAGTRRIGRIAIDPADPQRVFVAAAGGVYAPDTNRGVYRSTNGGASWTQVLFAGDDAGAVDLALDPGQPNRIYAALWEHYGTKTQWVAGGTRSGIYRSTDGGTSWTRLANGLPAPSPVVGRIGLAVAPSAPQTVYAIYRDDPGALMGIWKTTDAGESWARIDDPAGDHIGQFVTYGYYFGQIRVDPANPGIVYALDVNWFRSTDGGVNWAVFAPASLHVDHHDLVIQPGGRLLMGNDGGFYSSTDGGATWLHAVTLPISQFYDLGIDPRNPLRRFGGLQDNGSVRTTDGGLANWSRRLGGDGFQCEVDPTNSNLVYCESQYGNIARSTNGGTGFSGARSGIDTTERVNWNAPITHDPRVSQKLYTGTIRVYRSLNGAVSWSAFSPDLTNGPSTQGLSGGGAASGSAQRVEPGRDAGGAAQADHAQLGPGGDTGVAAQADQSRLRPGGDAGVLASAGHADLGPGGEAGVAAQSDQSHLGPGRVAGGAAQADQSHLASAVDGTVTTIAVSAVDAAVVWAGTDDGNVWVTADAGAHWALVNVPGRSEWVTRLEADPFDAGTAYVTFSGYREASYLPHIFRTADLGVHWADISGNLPQVPLNCVAADPDWPGRLFVGSDLGVYVTDDWGLSWSPMNGGMPLVVVHDLDLVEATRTLFAGTHARSMWSYALGQLPRPDRDGDGVVNVLDCAPDDAGAFALPAEVSGLSIAADRRTLTWDSAAPAAGAGSVHQIVRGALAELPVGAGGTEVCLDASDPAATRDDPSAPGAGSGLWYLVRGKNACGWGTYGATSSGVPRATNVCP